ncbi:MAG: HEAT repeat domain-containing protein, partial [Promethearchaeota archaeon]
MNMLLSFLQINKDVVFQLFQTFPFLTSIGDIFNHYEILVPLIVVQSFITLVYGISALVKKNSDFQADVRLQATSEAFGISDLEDLIEIRKTHMHQLMEKEIEDKEEKSIDKKQKNHFKKETKRLNKLKKKETKYNYQTLYKSLLIEPCYSSYGIDVNEQIRFKSEQYLLLIASESKENAQKIVDFVFKSSLSLSKQEIEEIKYISKESIDLLGVIGAIYPEIVLDRLIDRLDKVEIFLQRQILDALGDIGEVKANMGEILSKIHSLFDHPRYEVRQAAFSAVTEMILEGNSEDKDVVNLALKYIYEVLEQKKKPEVIDSCLEAVVKMSARIGDDIDLDRIVPFLHYNFGNSQDTINYIQQNAIIVLSYIVYYNTQKFPKLIPDLEKFLDDSRSFIRYVTADVLGNFILKGPVEFQGPILLKLMEKSLNDDDPDVTEMCTESVQEFLIVNKGYQVNIDGNKTSILDYYTNGLFSENRMIAENSSEALKSISPLYDEDIYPILESKIKEMKDLEVVRDCLHVIATSGEEEHLSTDLELIYSLAVHEESSVRAEALFCLGNLAKHRPEIDEKILFKCLDDSDPQVRLEAIFALGKLGFEKPQQVSQVLIQKIFEIDRASEEKVSEIELYAESLGIIGSYYPSNEIIITLQSALIGDTNPFAKDVIAHALGEIGNGMIRSGKAIRRIESSEFYNQISWLRSSSKKEYTIGNLVIIFIEALQLKGIPASVMNEISDAIQDLLPVFLFTKVPGQKKENILLETIKEMLAQAYYANYSSEILETIDRIDSMISFKRYFETNDKFLQQQFLFFAKQYTPDGKQFHDQGETFMVLNKTRKERKYLGYAFKSFEIAQELAPYDYFTPDVVLQQGNILMKLEKYSEAKNKFVEALEIFTSLDDVARMKECGEALEEIAKKQ